ncbi:MAG: acyltransferase, partial [Clostridiales bacterium]|nr:acyltransferase [Clostridiales bacterium]
IWPISAMAAGGMLGNIIFFAVSGFCLAEIKGGFIKWYLKRFLRVYPVMAIFTLITILTGFYSVTGFNDVVRFFVYPTNYIFLVWLMVLYAIFYFVAWLAKKEEKVWWITIVAVFVCWITVYMLFVDKTKYVIDDVSSPFIMFLYFSSMLIGALFKKKKNSFTKIKWYELLLLAVSLILYFGSKIIFSKKAEIASVQIVNQFCILFALVMIFIVMIGMESTLSKFNGKIKSIIKFVANITLQIYIVQFIVIRKFESLVFPLNFVVVTALIILLASLVYFAEVFIRRGITAMVKNKKEEKVETSGQSNN